MSVLMPMPRTTDRWEGWGCFYCRYKSGDPGRGHVKAVAIHIDDTGGYAPLCGYHAEGVEVTGYILAEWLWYWPKAQWPRNMAGKIDLDSQ